MNVSVVINFTMTIRFYVHLVRIELTMSKNGSAVSIINNY